MIRDLLTRANAEAGFTASLLGTQEGLLLAFSGDVGSSEEMAGFASLFRGVVTRAERDLEVRHLDEVTLLDPRRGRIVIRPLRIDDALFFLVVRLPTTLRWRRATNRLCDQLTDWLQGTLPSNGRRET